MSSSRQVPPGGALVIGIDFGTTYSKVAYTFNGEPSANTKIVDNWPSVSIEDAIRPHVPSKIHYHKKTGRITWGYNIPVAYDPVQWFKMLLPSHDDLPDFQKNSTYIHDARHKVGSLGKTAVQVAGDYLRCLFHHSLKFIEDKEGAHSIKKPIIVILTVPATWRSAAISSVYLAAHHGGLAAPLVSKLLITTEPYSAMIAMSRVWCVPNPVDYECGDHVVLADIGGGTVDVIGYTVERPKPLSLETCVESTGIMCGGAFLDEEFQSFVKSKIGHKSWESMDVADIRDIMDQWEYRPKRYFDGSSRPCLINIPGRGSMGQLQLTPKHLCAIFDKTIDRFLPIIGKQVMAVYSKTNELPKAVVLVGGLSRNPYVMKCIQKTLPDVFIRRAEKDFPVTAVCNGATYYGTHRLQALGLPTSDRIRTPQYSYFMAVETQTYREATSRFEQYEQIEKILDQGQATPGYVLRTAYIRHHWTPTTRGTQTIRLRVFAQTGSNPSVRTDVETLTFDLPTKIQHMSRVQEMGTELRCFKYSVSAQVNGEWMKIVALTISGVQLARTDIQLAYN
ncbi:hypothetical protein F4677DRAFT_463031 [Hypoxylon crocopeplum]|nr:hypothetical protein F4677DRAFT_463031 [Hypoxylon crocopeplum]